MRNNRNIKFFIIFYIFLMIFSVFCTFFGKKLDFFYNYFSKYDKIKFCYIIKNKQIINEKIYDKVIESGGYDFVYFSEKTSNIDAVYKQVEIDDCEDILSKVINDLNAIIVKTEMVDKTKITYLYTPFIKQNIKDGINKINLQVANSKDKTIIGCPIIYSGY